MITQLKLIIAILLVFFGLTTYVKARQASTISYVVYWGSWSSWGRVKGMGECRRSNPKNKVPKGVTQLNLSFANIMQKGESYDVVGSDDFLNPDQAKDGKNQPYNIWTGFKYHNPKVKILLAIGGESYSQIWTSILTPESAEAIAASIKKAVNKKYPAYHYNSRNVAKFLGNVKIDGVDLDVESPKELTAEQAQNIALLISKLREKLPNKLITLTSLSTAADPEHCKITHAPNCSRVGSPHSGEIIPVLVAVENKLDYVNIMAYEAGKNYKYKISFANYRKYVPANKLLLGLDLEKQWDPQGKFLESTAEMKARAHWIKKRGKAAGIFVWGIIGNASPSYPANGPNGQLAIIGQIIGERAR